MSSVSLQTIFTPAEHMNNVFVCKVSGTGKIVQHCIGNLINSLQTSIFLGVMLSLNSDMFYVWQLLYLFELPHSLSTSRSPQATPVTRSRTFQRGEQGRTGKNCNWQWQQINHLFDKETRSFLKLSGPSSVPNPSPKSKIKSPDERDWSWGWRYNPRGHHLHHT